MPVPVSLVVCHAIRPSNKIKLIILYNRIYEVCIVHNLPLVVANFNTICPKLEVRFEKSLQGDCNFVIRKLAVRFLRVISLPKLFPKRTLHLEMLIHWG